MGQILSTKEFKVALTEAASREASHIWIASAYVKFGAFKWLHEKVASETQITLVGRFLPNDLITGSSDISVIEYCLDNNIQIGMHNRLHAKFYNFVGMQRSFLGSANLTNSGLGLGAEGNEEMTRAFEPKLHSEVTSILSSQIEWIDEHTLKKMTEYIQHAVRGEADQHGDWPFNSKTKSPDRFFSSEFPDIRPNAIGQEASIFLHNSLNDLAQKMFCSSAVHHWVIQEVRKKNDVYTNFGWLTSKIHDALLDDPVPFRSGVKEICALLFEWIEEFSDELEIEQHERTKSLRIK